MIKNLNKLNELLSEFEVDGWLTRNMARLVANGYTRYALLGMVALGVFGGYKLVRIFV